MALSNSVLGNINISLPPNVASSTILEPIEGLIAENVQDGISELVARSDDSTKAEGLAKSGENTDITSLGTANDVLTIKSKIRLPNLSRFKLFDDNDFFTNPNVWEKIFFYSTAKDQLNEVSQSGFYSSQPGLYNFECGFYFYFPSATKAYLALRVNGDEAVLLDTRSFFANDDGFLKGSAAIELSLNDCVECFLYTTSPTKVNGAQMLKRVYFAGYRIG